MKTLANRFLSGVRVVPNGIRIVKENAGLKRYIIIPIAINIILFLVGLFWVSSEVGGIVESILGNIQDWNETLFSIVKWLLIVGVWIAVMGGLVLVLYFGSSIVASPFYSLLAERSLMTVGDIKTEPFHWGRWIATSAKMLIISLAKAFILLAVALLVFIASLIPIVNIGAYFATFVLIAFDCSDYVLEVKELGLGQRFQFLRRRLPELSGIALVLMALSLIPGVIFIAIPFTIAGLAQLIHQISDSSVVRS